MRTATILLAGAAVLILWSSERAGAQTDDAAGPVHTPPPAAVPVYAKPSAFQPCFGSGYLAYPYPGFDTCPCGSDCCFHPGRYYHGGKPYRREWFGRWLRSHHGHGSMLDGYPHQCIFPRGGRPYIIAPAAPVAPAEMPDVPPPAPAPAIE